MLSLKIYCSRTKRRTCSTDWVVSWLRQTFCENDRVGQPYALWLKQFVRQHALKIYKSTWMYLSKCWYYYVCSIGVFNTEGPDRQRIVAHESWTTHSLERFKICWYGAPISSCRLHDISKGESCHKQIEEIEVGAKVARTKICTLLLHTFYFQYMRASFFKGRLLHRVQKVQASTGKYQSGAHFKCHLQAAGFFKFFCI